MVYVHDVHGGQCSCFSAQSAFAQAYGAVAHLKGLSHFASGEVSLRSNHHYGVGLRVFERV